MQLFNDYFVRYILTEIICNFIFIKRHLDFCGPFKPSAAGNTDIIVAIDRTSCWVEAVTTNNKCIADVGK